MRIIQIGSEVSYDSSIVLSGCYRSSIVQFFNGRSNCMTASRITYVAGSGLDMKRQSSRNNIGRLEVIPSTLQQECWRVPADRTLNMQQSCHRLNLSTIFIYGQLYSSSQNENDAEMLQLWFL